MTFKDQYQALEKEFIKQVQRDNEQFGINGIYLPNNPPKDRVDYVLVAMEPSLGKWAGDIKNAQCKIESGFKNFAYSLEDYILHFCIKKYLCRENKKCHVTDISKGAMLTKNAKFNRGKRYENWHALLKKEIELISSPNTKVISIGGAVNKFLNTIKIQNHTGSILHYSQNAAKYRKDAILGRENEYIKFAPTITLEEILSTATDVLKEYDMSHFQIETLERLQRSRLTESRKNLIFTYKIQLGRLKD